MDVLHYAVWKVPPFYKPSLYILSCSYQRIPSKFKITWPTASESWYWNKLTSISFESPHQFWIGGFSFKSMATHLKVFYVTSKYPYLAYYLKMWYFDSRGWVTLHNPSHLGQKPHASSEIAFHYILSNCCLNALNLSNSSLWFHLMQPKFLWTLPCYRSLLVWILISYC